MQTVIIILVCPDQVTLVVKNLSANAGDIRDVDSMPRSGRSSGGGHSNPLQYSCLENPMDRGTWMGTVHSVAKSETQLKQLSIQPQCLKKVNREYKTNC